MTQRLFIHCLAAAAKSLQSCPTLYDPIDGSPQGSPIPGIFPGKNTGVGCHFLSNAWKWKVKVKSLSHVRLLATPWTAAHQALPSTGFSCNIPKRHQAVYAIDTMKPPVLQRSLFKSDCTWVHFLKKIRAGKKRCTVCPDECNCDETDLMGLS